MTEKSTMCAAKHGGNECSEQRVSGKLFCQRHQWSDSRLRMGQKPLSNEQLTYMMRRDGEQQ